MSENVTVTPEQLFEKIGRLNMENDVLVRERNALVNEVVKLRIRVDTLEKEQKAAMEAPIASNEPQNQRP